MSSDQEPRSHTSNNDPDIPDSPDPAVVLLAAIPAPSKQEVTDGLLLDAVDGLPTRDIEVAETEGLSSGETIGMNGNPDSPLRIVVRCLSHKIPGPRFDRTATMANIICQHYFQRDMDREKDHIRSLGLQDIDGEKVRFLLESGTVSLDVKMEDVPLVAFKWNGEKLVPRDVDARTHAYVHNLPFKHKPPTQKPQKPKTMAQMRESMDAEAWNKFMQEVVLRKLQYEKRPSDVERSWAMEHPELFYDVMQQCTAQKRWHKLELPPSQKQWVEAQKDRESPSTLALIDMVLNHMGVEKECERPAPCSARKQAEQSARGAGDSSR